MSKDFQQIFAKNEFETLAGLKWRNIWSLAIILIVTFISLGHVVGGLNRLDKSMNNPYTNWVDVKNTGVAEKGNALLREELDSLRVKYDVNSINPYQEYFFEVFYNDLRDSLRLSIRNISLDDPLMEVVLEESNIYQAFDVLEPECSVILSKKAMQNKMGIDELDTLSCLPIRFDTEESIHFMVPISHVVEELPSDVDILVSDKFIKMYAKGGSTGFYEIGPSRQINFLSQDRLDIAIWSTDDRIYDIDPIDAIIVWNKIYYNYQLFFNNDLSFTQRIQYMDSLKQDPKLFPYMPFQCVDVRDYNFSIDQYSYHFNSLDKIREFKKYASLKLVNVPIHQVESKYNFVIVSYIAYLFIFLLLGFAIFSVALYLNNLLRNHLEKIKPNLGTLKAFGLPEKKVHNMYLQIINRFFLIGSLISIGATILYYLIGKLVFVDSFLFSLFNWQQIMLWVLLWIFLVIFFTRIIKKILYRTPGDLIYNR